MYRKYRASLGDLLVMVIDFVFGLAIVGLTVRFLFRLFDANPFSDFVQFVYDSTQPLLDPFRGIFEPDVIEPGSVVEYSSLIAIVFYMFLAWLLAEIIYMIEVYAKSRKE
ncbi:YggT family protein [Candidatus Dojkabacteria bacterium]|nr:YggT family protein [Candidatus Dojkabacteria bacterium]